jgi:flagellar biosynthesis GTPase FlhF
MLQQVGLAGPSTPAGARKGDRSEVVAGAAMKAAVVYVTAADLNSAIKSVAAVKKCVGKGVVSEEIEEVVVGQQCAASPCEDGTIAEEREGRKLREAEEESEAVAETKGYDKQAQHRQEEVEEDESKPAAEETLGDDNQAQHQMEEGDVVVEEESEPVVEETLGDDKQAQQQQDEVEEDESEPVAEEEEEGRQEEEVSREKAAEDGMSPEGGGSVERNLLSKRSESEATEQAEPSQVSAPSCPRCSLTRTGVFFVGMV